MINTASLNLIKSFEGLKLTAYLCPANVPTIGYGTTQGVTHSDVGKRTITEAEATRLLLVDVKRFEKAVDDVVKVKLTDNQRGALVSLAYNIGASAFAGSTLVSKLNRGDVAGASEQFARWNKGGGKILPGLVRRRAAEAVLFRTK